MGSVPSIAPKVWKREKHKQLQFYPDLYGFHQCLFVLFDIKLGGVTVSNISRACCNTVISSSKCAIVNIIYNMQDRGVVFLCYLGNTIQYCFVTCT